MSRIMSVWPVNKLVHTPVRASQALTLPSTQAVNTSCTRRDGQGKRAEEAARNSAGNGGGTVSSQRFVPPIYVVHEPHQSISANIVQTGVYAFVGGGGDTDFM